MPHVRRLPALLVLSALLLLGGAAPASAQAMDGQWFKLKVSSKGFTVDEANGDAVQAASFKTTAYLILTWDGVSRYAYELWTEVSPGAWAPTHIDVLSVLIGANEALGTDDPMDFAHQNGGHVYGFFNTRFVIKKNAAGEFVSATLKSLGGEAIDDSTLDGTNPYRGNLVIKGKTVPVSKLPFTP